MQDSLLIFSSAQAITATAPSTNVLDMLTLRDEGVGNMIEINVYVSTLFTTSNAATLQIALQGSFTAGGGGTYYDILLSPVIAVAALTLGAHLFAVPLPRLYQPNAQAVNTPPAPPQYLRLNYTVGTGVFTAGALNAWLSADMDRQAYYNYKNNYTV